MAKFKYVYYILYFKSLEEFKLQFTYKDLVDLYFLKKIRFR